MTAILWPDVEAALIAYLKPRITASPLTFAADVRVSNTLTARENDPRPDYALIVRNDGGPPSETVFADVNAGFNVWAPDKASAVALAHYAAALINGMPESGATPFTNASARVAYDIAEPVDATHLYFTASLTVRGADL